MIREGTSSTQNSGVSLTRQIDVRSVSKDPKGSRRKFMVDVLLVAVAIAFFAICVGYVKVCDRIIGTDEEAMPQ